MTLQDRWDRYYNEPVTRLWESVDQADEEAVDRALERAHQILMKAHNRIKLETGYCDPALEQK